MNPSDGNNGYAMASQFHKGGMFEFRLKQNSSFLSITRVGLVLEGKEKGTVLKAAMLRSPKS